MLLFLYHLTWWHAPNLTCNKVNKYSINLAVLIESSTRRHSDEEIDRVFCYFEDGMQTAKISKLLGIPRQTDTIVIEDIDIYDYNK